MSEKPLTQLLNADPADLTASQQHDLSEVYDQLRSIARVQRIKVRASGLDTTALVNEAWLKSRKYQKAFNDRNHFYAYCAVAMRHILYNLAKRNQLVTVIAADPEYRQNPVHDQSEFLIDLQAHLCRLREFEPRLEQVFTYKFFGDMTMDAIATLLGVSERTVLRDWKKARAMLSVALAG